MSEIECGWHVMDEAAYHADPCPTPALSASIGKQVIGKSLAHAWSDHVKNPDRIERAPSIPAEIGKAVHSIVFGGANIVVIEAKSYQGKAAKAARDEITAAGKIPVLETSIEIAHKIAEGVSARFDELYDGKYLPERVAVWKCPRTGGWRKAMMDTSSDVLPVIVDLKTTQSSVDTESCIQRIYSDNHQIQSAAYEEGMEECQPEWKGRVRFYFLYAEQKPPYAISAPLLMPEAGMTLGREQWQAAGALWDAAVQTGRFPAYGQMEVPANPPLWRLTQWENRQMTDNMLIPGAE